MNMKSSSAKKKNQYIASIKAKLDEFAKNHPEISCLAILAIACLIFLFFGLGLYPLIDVDETRYAVMARDLLFSNDWNSLMLNGVPFLEKPPLYFWLVGASIKLFNAFNPFVVRFPIALITSFLIFFTYYVGKKTISRKYGMLSALTLISSAFFLILAHVAILDMVLTVFMTSAIYCGLLSHFCKEENKEYCWFFFYLFIGLGFLSKGILALAIPIVIMFFYNMMTKTLKDMFRLKNILPGGLIFLALIFPWHYLMYDKYGFLFVKDYFLIHHFGRFMGSEYIGRERPLLYFVPVFLLGFLPWTFVFLSFLYDEVKKLIASFKKGEVNVSKMFEINTNEQKIISFATLSFIIIFLVFSSSSTKLPTYILPIFPFASLIMAYFWWNSDEKGENAELIHGATLFFSMLLIVIAIITSFGYTFLPASIKNELFTFIGLAVAGIYMVGIFMFFRLDTKRPISIYSGYLITMFFVITLAVSQIFNLVYNGGENELVNYSTYCASSVSKPQLVTFDFAVKPSVMINYHDKIHFITDPDFKALDKLLTYETGPTFVIVKNKNLRDNEGYQNEIKKRLFLIKVGARYSLYAKAKKGQYLQYYLN